MVKVAILLFIMQLNSMLAVGLGWLPQSVALSVRVCVGGYLLYHYIRNGKMHYSLYVLLLVMLTLFVINDMMLIINFIFVSLMIYSIKDNGEESIIKSIYYSTIALSLIFIVISLNGILHPTILYSPDTGRYRNSLGFISPNYPGLIAFSCIVALFSCIGMLKSKVGKKSKVLVVIIALFCLVIPLLTDSRTPLYTLIVSFIFYVLLRFSFFRLLTRIFIPLVPAIFMGLTLYIAFYYNHDVNALLSGRPYLYSLYLKDFGWVDYLLGGEGTQGFSVDSSYLLLLSCFGVFSFFIIATLLYKCLVNNKNKYVYAMFFSIFVYGLSESIMVRPEISVVFLFYSLLAIKSDKIMNHDEYNCDT
ncbi:TPA: hypothetical protein L1N01_004025 [Escherichia coli]|uniref:hypothetical protein n=1 Tax=Escherichia coli TaxID=562 RepID=UPI003754244B|nr:hypothetical protein [Escherichia coli]HBN0506329.1 hypothetical protein [Escherichia coli]